MSSEQGKGQSEGPRPSHTLPENLMEPYEERAECPKCRGAWVSTEYRAHGRVLYRRCMRCGYGWAEAPLDRGADHD